MSLIVLHGTWSSGSGRFFLWGEDAFRASHKRRSTAQHITPKHPYQLQLPELFHLSRIQAEACQFTILLPTVLDLGPLPSPELAVDQPDRMWTVDEVAPAPWSVTGLALSPGETLPWLASPPTLPAEYALGSDLRLWQQVAHFGLDLLTRERYIPAIRPRGSEAYWRLLLAETADEKRLQTLSESLPPVSQALLPPRTQAPLRQPHDPQKLIVDFLEHTADALIRCWLEAAITGRSPAQRSPVEEWLDALASDDPHLRTQTSRSLAPIATRWMEPLVYTAENPAPTPVRACLRLEPPEPPSPHAEWTLRIMLQAVDQPDLLLPASEVWQAQGKPFRHLDRRIQHPPERLLAALGHAARLFPPLSETMRWTDRLECCPLSVSEACQFLKEAAEPLAEAGFGVVLPASLQKRAKVTARARVRTPKSGPSSLGLSQVLEVDWDLALGDNGISLTELQQIARLKAPLLQWRGQWVELDSDLLIRLVRQLEGQTGRISVGEALRLTTEDTPEVMGIPVDDLELDTSTHQLVERLHGRDQMTPLPPPRGLIGQLRPYQERGFSWLAFLREVGIGACLADDMGLGKSIQVIAMLLHEREAKLALAPTLLICPTSLVGNWQRELARFAPSLKVMVHQGATRLKHEAFAEAAGSHDVVLSTYALSHRDMADLMAVPWAGLVLDEAQNIKNAGTRQSQSLKSLPAGYRIALTGTPVENRLSELWSLMDFLNPGYLGSAADFQTRFATRIERHGDERAANQLRRLVQPFLLRRVKTDPTIISDLPEKLEQPVYVNLTTEQASLYAAVVEEMMAQIERAEGIQRRGLVLAALTRLKQICNHPAQFLRDGSRLEDRSGKLERLVAMLQEVLAEEHRALVFTQYAEMGHKLQQHLAAVLGREVLFLHGGVAGDDRLGMVQRFQADEGPPIFILTIKAGGVGLNLTQASHVFHFDRWWNPAVENQATDRAYRIGQTRNVMVHKLITAGTVEEKIDALIEGKRQLSDRIVTTGENWLTELTSAELRTLFTLERE